MQTQIKPNSDGSFNLYVNGRLEIQEETFAVCDRVADSLNYGPFGPSEIEEVADSIRHSTPEARPR